MGSWYSSDAAAKSPAILPNSANFTPDGPPSDPALEVLGSKDTARLLAPVLDAGNLWCLLQTCRACATSFGPLYKASLRRLWTQTVQAFPTRALQPMKRAVMMVGECCLGEFVCLCIGSMYSTYPCLIVCFYVYVCSLCVWIA